MIGGVTYKEIPQISRLHPDGAKEVYPMFINGSGVEIEKVYLEEADKKQAVIMPERINFLEVPDGTWCDNSRLRSYEKKIIEAERKVDRMKKGRKIWQ